MRTNEFHVTGDVLSVASGVPPKGPAPGIIPAAKLSTGETASNRRKKGPLPGEIRKSAATLRLVPPTTLDANPARETATTIVEPSIGDAVAGFARLTELALEEASMSLTQYRILQHLRHGHTIQSDLAFRLAVTKQSVTRLVDALVEKRYITRRVDQVDRRRVLHAITTKGKRAMDRADAIIERYLMAVLQDLDDDDDIEAVRHGIELFGAASRASYERVRPDGIVPGPRSQKLGQK